MTLEQLIKDYRERFILILNTVGEINSNDSFKNAEQLIRNREDGIQKFIDMGASFSVLVVFMTSVILVDMYGPEEVSSWGDIADRKECKSVYNKYLKEMTDKFTRKNGLSQVNLSEVHIKYVA